MVGEGGEFGGDVIISSFQERVRLIEGFYLMAVAMTYR